MVKGMKTFWQKIITLSKQMVFKLEPLPALSFLQAYKDTGWLSGHYVHEQNLDKWIQYLTEYKQNPSKFNIIGDGIYIPTEDNPEGIRYYLNEKNIRSKDLRQTILSNFNGIGQYSYL